MAGVNAEPPAAERSAKRLVIGRQVGAAPAGGVTSVAPSNAVTVPRTRRLMIRVMGAPRVLGAGPTGAQHTL